MKKVFFLFLIFPFLMSFGMGPKNDIILQGKITNAPKNFIIISITDSSKDTVKLNANGDFSYKNSVSESKICNIVIPEMGPVPVYISGAMNLDISIDCKDRSSLKIKGVGADKNNYLIEKNKNNKLLKAEDNKPDRWLKDSTSFFIGINEIRDGQLKFLKDFKKDNPNDPFWKLQKTEIVYGWGNAILAYPFIYKNYADSTFKAKPGFFNRAMTLDINDPELLASSEFKSYLRTLFEEKVNAETKTLDNTKQKKYDAMALLKMAKSHISNGLVLDYFMMDVLKGRLLFQELSDMKEEIKFFRDNCKGEMSKAEFEKELAKWKLLAKGEPAIEFTGETPEGKKVKLSDFKGKYVFVDVWATWCGPCRYQYPFIKKLEHEFNTRNIVFVGYSIDEDREAWKKFIVDQEFKGVQLVGEAAWNSKFIKDYKIMGVPTFLFFDMEGKIISVRMTRPSEEVKIREIFNSMPGL